MFIGHYAVALAAKKAAPKTSFGTLFLAAQFIDLLWPLLLLLGIEHVRIDPGNTAFTPLDFYDYPITHSLLAVIGWSLAFGMKLPDASVGVSSGVLSIVNDASVGELNPNKINLFCPAPQCKSFLDSRIGRA